MKKLLLFIVLFGLAQHSALAQCNFDTVDVDDFEYSTTIVGLQSGTVYHYSPMSLKVAHSPTRYCYMNFVNNIATNTLVFDRTYNVCGGNEYRFSAWFNEINGGSSSYDLKVKDANGTTLITSSQTNSSTSWTQWQSTSFTPTTSTVQLQLLYTGGTGNNDLAMDDIVLEVCEIDPISNDSISVCNRSTINLLDSISMPHGSSGSWTGPSTLGNDSLGTFDANNMLPGQYTYTLSNGSNCPDSIGTVYVDVNTVDTAVGLSNGVLTANSSNASYQWIDCGTNQAISGETSQSFTPTSNGSYAVEITENGCTDTSSCNVISNIGLRENELLKMVVSPNPTTGVLNISLGNQHKVVTITVFNTLGQALMTLTDYNVRELKLDFSDLKTDMYYLNVHADNEQRTIKVLRLE